MIDGAPGHGEGHNSARPLNITAALAVKRLMEREKMPGTIRIWPGTAEELVGTKAYFVRAGLFKDADIVLFSHVGNNLASRGVIRDRQWARLGRVHRSSARARTAPARRGAAAARSTPSS